MRVRGAAAAAVVLTASGLLLAPAASAANSAESAVVVSVGDAYNGSIGAGGWVPVAVTVTNRGADFQGTAMVTVAGADSSGGHCMSTGSGVACFGSSGPTGFSGAAGPQVGYRLPIQVAAGTTKTVVVDVLAGSAPVHAAVLNRSGATVASADGTLGIVFGSAPSSVAVVSDDDAALAAFGEVRTPNGGQVQVVHLAPSALPASGPMLDGFTLVAVDDASTQELSAAQRDALADFVDGGGTLLLSAGVQGAATVAGLPDSLVPATLSDASPVVLSQLAGFLGTAPPSGPVEVSGLIPHQARTTFRAGSTPLIVEAQHGSGRVILTAFDLSAPPLDAWPGTQALLRQLIVASGHLAPLTYVGGAAPAGGLAGDAGFMAGPTSDIPPFSLPSSLTLVLLLAGYVLLAGPVNFWVLGRLRRRDLAWLTVPALAVCVAVGAYGAALGTSRSASVDEVRVIALQPGANRAEVSSFGATYLAHGGAYRFRLPAGSLVTNLGAGTNAPSVEPAAGPAVTMSGGHASEAGFSAVREATAPGSLMAHLSEQGGTITGTVANHLGVGLSDLVLVMDSSGPQDLGPLAAGATKAVNVSVSAGSGLQPGGPGFYSGLSFSGPAPGPAHREALRRQEVFGGLEQMAMASQNGTGIVLAGVATAPVLPPDIAGGREQVRIIDGVLEPVTLERQPGAQIRSLPAQLLDTTGLSTGKPGMNVMGAGVQVSEHGSALFSFALPGASWSRLELTVAGAAGQGIVPGEPNVVVVPGGSPVVPTAHSFAVDVYNPGSATWDVVTASGGTGALTIPDPGSHVSQDGAVIIRVRPIGRDLMVTGYPTLDADPVAASGASS